jgi:cation-transporting ATPase E
VPAGLSDAEVRSRRARGLGNVLPPPTGRTYSEIVRDNVLTFINSVLFGLGIALVLLGHGSDALVSLGVVTINVLVGVVQEVRAKRTLDRIALLSRPRAIVLRDGAELSVDPGEVVRGDVAIVRPGDQVVVDGVVLEGGRLGVDESLLTGESDLVPKTAGDPVYAGSFCASSSARYLTQGVGAASLAHQLTLHARAFRRVLTPLQRQIHLVVRVILLVAVSFGIVLVVHALVGGFSLAEGVRIAVVIAGLVPNGLFVAIAVAYALGAVRMAGKGVLVQQANAVESLSHVDVLCLDKTGTLTTGQVALDAIHPFDEPLAVVQRRLGDFLASATGGNRTTAAIAAGCPGRARPVLDEVPFSSAWKWSALAFGEGELPGTDVLGAPEVLLPHLTSPAPSSVEALVAELAAAGRRLLLFAHDPMPRRLRDASGLPVLPSELIPLGVVALRDELRPDARRTLADFASAGIALRVLSGDDPRTARTIAVQAGFPPDSRVASGLDLGDLDEAGLAELTGGTRVFGRLSPQQKERLVRALQARGHYVGFIGDGVNDVLALKRADLAIALRSGSQAARAVADLVLLDDAFSALPAAFREGQRIVHGMQDILRLFLARVLSVALLIAAVGAVDAGFPLAPKHNALLTLLTVGIPSIALAAWARPGPQPGRWRWSVWRSTSGTSCPPAPHSSRGRPWLLRGWRFGPRRRWPRRRSRPSSSSAACC